MGHQISDLPSISSCQLTDLIPEVQPATGGTTYKATLQQLSDLIVSQVPSSALPYTLCGSNQQMEANNGYVAAPITGTVFELPTTATFGSRLEVIGMGAGWNISAGDGQSIQIGSSSTSTIDGNLIAGAYDSLVLICIVADTTWAVLGAPQSSVLNLI